MLRKQSTLFATVALGLLPVLGGCGAGVSRAADTPAPSETGATSSIQQSSIGSGPLTLRDLLQGKTSGLEFVQLSGGGEKIRIRGMSSINDAQNQEPLIMVDGLEVPANQLSSALAALTRDDIKRVDVLKDVASTSSYGMRGAGGVILIFTNRR